MSERPKTLGDFDALLGQLEGQFGPTPQGEVVSKLRSDLRRILYGTDTEPGLAERVLSPYWFESANDVEALKAGLTAEIASPESTP